MLFNKLFQSKKQKPVDPNLWLQKVYDTISDADLWTKKISYDDYIKKIEEYSKKLSKFPSEQDLLNPTEFTRGIFFALDKDITFIGAYDYEYGYDSLFEALSQLFKKTNLNFSWKKINNSLYQYEIEGKEHKLLLKNEEDTAEVSGVAFKGIDKNINNILDRKGLCLMHTPTGDQTTDYLIIKKEFTEKLKEIFPTDRVQFPSTS